MNCAPETHLGPPIPRAARTSSAAIKVSIEALVHNRERCDCDCGCVCTVCRMNATEYLFLPWCAFPLTAQPHRSPPPPPPSSSSSLSLSPPTTSLPAAKAPSNSYSNSNVRSRDGVRHSPPNQQADLRLLPVLDKPLSKQRSPQPQSPQRMYTYSRWLIHPLHTYIHTHTCIHTYIGNTFWNCAHTTIV